MDLINNRYRIVENLSQNLLMSSYLVMDIIDNREKMNLHIVSCENIRKKLMDHLLGHGLETISMSITNILKVNSFGTVDFIDNKKISSSKMYYTTPHVEKVHSLLDICRTLSFDCILDIFVNMCKTINTLHLKGYVYEEINLVNVGICMTNENYTAVFKDLLSSKLDPSVSSSDNFNLLFKAPEVLAGGTPSITSDIYSLGVLFLVMINNKQPISSFNLKTSACALKGSFGDPIYKIISKMLSSNRTKRLKSLTALINEINAVLGRNDEPFFLKDLEILNFNTRLVGRDYETNTILNEFNKIKSMDGNCKFILVHGDSGIGKTRILHEIDKKLKLQNESVYSSFSLSSAPLEPYSVLRELLSQITCECDKSLMVPYEADLVKIMPELNENKNMPLGESLSGDKKKFQLINSVYNFLLDITERGNSNVIIIDNIDFASANMIEFLDYLHVRITDKKKMMFILSYNDHGNNQNYCFSKFLDKVKGNSSIIDLHLRSLTSSSTCSMIKNILSFTNYPSSFSMVIHNQTDGNPLFIEETLKYFFSKGILTINPKTGSWQTQYDNDYHNLPIPKNLEQAVLNQIKGIDQLSLNILSSICIFNNATTMESLSKFVPYEMPVIERSISDLINKGILCRKIDDRGFVFDFLNKLLKSTLYNRLSLSQQQSYHELASSILENELDDVYVDKEELIYHLEKCNNKKKIITHCTKNAEKMLALRNSSDALRNLLKAVSMFDEDDLSLERTIILKSIADLYFNDGNVSDSIKCYNEALSISTSLNNVKLEIDCLSSLAKCYFSKNDLNTAKKYINISHGLLSSYDYVKGYLDINRTYISILILQHQFNEANDLCKSCISLCGNEFLELKGYFYISYGDSFMYANKIDEALECFNKSISYFKKINHQEGIVGSLNNIAGIYADYYQDYARAMNAFNEMKQICEHYKFYYSQILSLINIGEIYYESFEYEQAYSYYKDALKISLKTESERNTLYCYIYLCMICAKLNKFKESYHYYRLAEKEIDTYPTFKYDYHSFSRASAEMHFHFGNMPKALCTVNKTLEALENDESRRKLDLMELECLIKISLGENCQDLLASILAKYPNFLDKVNLLLEYCIRLCLQEKYSEALDLMNSRITVLESNICNSRIAAKLHFVQACLCKNDSEKLKHLLNCLKIARENKNFELWHRVCCSIGDYYSSIENYFYAVNYYLEACEITKKLALQIPDNMRIQFLKCTGMLDSFTKLNMFVSVNNLIELDEPSATKNYDLKCSKDVENLFSYDEFRSIINNRYFKASARKIYSESLPSGMNNLEDLIENLHNDPVENLTLLANFSASITLATRSLIIICDPGDNLQVISSSNDNFELPNNKFIFENVKATKKPFLLDAKSIKKLDKSFIMEDLKAAMCLPVIFKSCSKRGMDMDRQIKGYLYLESYRILNCFNKSSLKKCSSLVGLIGTMMDNYKLRISSSKDKLTSTLTRKFLDDSLLENIEKANSKNESFSIIMFDLDNFKRINDTFGHQTGDSVLSKVCNSVVNNLRTCDVVGRYGGEEFIIILPCMSPESALEIAERLRTIVENSKILGDKIPVTVSMGIAGYPVHGQWKEDLIERADRALYIAKKSGRNKCQLWNNNFSKKTKMTNKLSGIISGNDVSDYRNVLVITELIGLIKEPCSRENKIYRILGRIIENTEASYGMMFTFEDEKTTNCFCRKIFEESWQEPIFYSHNMLSEVIKKRQGIFAIDWDEFSDTDAISRNPDWHSVIVVPLVNSGVLVGALYLMVSTKIKEFDYNEFNFVNTLGELISSII